MRPQTINDKKMLELIDAGESQASIARRLGVTPQAVNQRLIKLRGRTTKCIVVKKVAEQNDMTITKIDESTPLYGNRGFLDSLSLVALVAGIEKELSKKRIDVSIISNQAFSSKRSPFLSVGTLERYINQLIEGAGHGKK